MSSTSILRPGVTASSRGAPWRMYAVNGVFFAVSTMLLPVYPFPVMQGGSTTTYFQVMSIACYAAQLAALFLSIRLLDKGRHARAHMIGASLLFAVALVIGALVRSPHTLLLGRIQ